jgi:Smg protein
MFDVLVFVYEHYWRGEEPPELEQLGRRLSAHGFEADEIQQALAWLDGLAIAAQGTSPDTPGTPPAHAPSIHSMRVY